MGQDTGNLGVSNPRAGRYRYLIYRFSFLYSDSLQRMPVSVSESLKLCRNILASFYFITDDAQRKRDI